MPARNRTKQYTENGYYHIYNRGVEKRVIFIDEQDYAVFLSYLKDYLTPKDKSELQEKLSNPNISYKEKDKILKLLRLKNFYGEITVLAYCLMPNHFHFFLKQKSSTSINQFLQSLSTRYSMYFNRKYKRVGSLYQDIYKAISIDTEEQFIYLSKYIHKQALFHKPSKTTTASQGWALRSWEQPSSYPEYMGKRKTQWVHPEEVLAYFSKSNPKLSYNRLQLHRNASCNLRYKAFVEEKDDFSVIGSKTLEED